MKKSLRFFPILLTSSFLSIHVISALEYKFDGKLRNPNISSGIATTAPDFNQRNPPTSIPFK